MVLTRAAEAVSLSPLKLARESAAVRVENLLAVLEQRDLGSRARPSGVRIAFACRSKNATDLKIEVLEDLDQSLLQPGDLEPVLDAPNEQNRVDARSNVFEKTSNEGFKQKASVQGRYGGEGGGDRPGLFSE